MGDCAAHIATLRRFWYDYTTQVADPDNVMGEPRPVEIPMYDAMDTPSDVPEEGMRPIEILDRFLACTTVVSAADVEPDKRARALAWAAAAEAAVVYFKLRDAAHPSGINRVARFFFHMKHALELPQPPADVSASDPRVPAKLELPGAYALDAIHPLRQCERMTTDQGITMQVTQAMVRGYSDDPSAFPMPVDIRVTCLACEEPVTIVTGDELVEWRRQHPDASSECIDHWVTVKLGMPVACHGCGLVLSPLARVNEDRHCFMGIQLRDL